MRGIHIPLPFKLGSLWIEWREVWVGFGMEHYPEDHEFFLGRLQGVYSTAAERGPLTVPVVLPSVEH